MKKSDIEQISNKLGWKTKEAEVAVREVYKTRSIVNIESIFRICLDAKNPVKRWQRVAVLLLENLIDKPLVETICYLLSEIDPCFNVVAVFNTYDVQSSDKKADIRFVFLTERKSFLKWYAGPTIKLDNGQKIMNKGYSPDKDYSLILTPSLAKENWVSDHPYMHPGVLIESFLNILISEQYRIALDNDKDIGYMVWASSILADVVSRVGFLAFELGLFRSIAKTYENIPIYKEQAEGLAKALISPLRDRSQVQRKYWLYYVLAEKLITEGNVSNPTKAFYRVMQLLKEAGHKVSEGAIRREYYLKTKIVKEQNFTLEDTITRNHLELAVKDLLQEKHKK